jgi:hypothetical protein
MEWQHERRTQITRKNYPENSALALYETKKAIIIQGALRWAKETPRGGATRAKVRGRI